MRFTIVGIALSIFLFGCGGESPTETDSPEDSVSSSSSSSGSSSSSSSSSGGYTPDPTALTDLQLRRDLWNSYGISEYKVVFSARYGNAQPIDVVLHVKDDEIVTITPIDPESGFLITENTFGLMTISEAFSQIESTLAVRAHQLSIQYDATYGFPTRFYRDHRADWMDDQDQWSYADLQIIQ